MSDAPDWQAKEADEAANFVERHLHMYPPTQEEKLIDMYADELADERYRKRMNRRINCDENCKEKNSV